MEKGRGKRSADAAFEKPAEKPQSPYMPMFEQLRDELDEHHDRRERIIKSSRDITAASKKIIFSLQRIRQVGYPVPEEYLKKRELHTIRTSYEAIVADVQGINTHRYARNITGGNQELMEAVAFQHYLETQRLISYDEAVQKLASASTVNGQHVALSLEDYLLGIFDSVGELMRFAITAMGAGGQISTAAAQQSEAAPQARTVLTDLLELRTQLELLSVSGSSLAYGYGKKLSVMQECVQKVERASYGHIVRGSERPKGWMPDLEDRYAGEVEVS